MSYPVDVFCFRFDWILTDNGRKFLNEISNNENLDIFRNRCMNMIIEFMYQEMKSILLRTMIPIQCINMITMMILAQINEWNNQNNFLNPVYNRVDISPRDEDQTLVDDLFSVSMIVHNISTILQIIINYKIMMGMKTVYFRKFSTWTEILTILCNILIQIQIRNSYVEDNENHFIDLEDFKANT